ncbi:hypothetical protein TWF679_009768 [Orbilia oligospora]|uniref:Uncharacterized protein n=1 Tax=Orbilia oligospora TaxID=2813651 RepID=A0A8H8V216_ORBOL|nr:hypothetical protein TWF679_009768 [Orbilia oligospora]
MDAILALAQLLGRAAPLHTGSAQNLPLQASELAAMLQLLQQPASTSDAHPGVPGEQFLLLVRCIVLDGATNQLAAPSAYKVVSMMGDVSFEGLIEAVTSRLSFSKLPGRQLRSMQACDTDGVQIVIDNDAAVRYLLGLLKRDSGVKMTVYAVDIVSPGEKQRLSSPTTAAEFDPSATPLYDTRCQTPGFASPTPSENTMMDGSRGRVQQRTPDRRRFSDDRSVSPVTPPRVPSRGRGYESAPSSCRTPIHHRSSHISRRSLSRSPSIHGEPVKDEEREEVPRSPEPRLHREILPPPTLPPHHPDERPRFCAVSISETGKNQYKHHIVDYLRLRLSTVNKFQQGWSHILDELFAQKPGSEQRPNNNNNGLRIEREEGNSTIMMLYMRVKGRPEDRSFYDTSGDVGIIINTKALVPGSFKWTERNDGSLLVSFSTDATYHVVRKNTDPKKDPYSQGPQVNGMNHIAVNIENVPTDRLRSPSFRAITSLLDGLDSGKGLDIVMEMTASQLPPNPPALMRCCLGAERDDGLVFERDFPFVVQKENMFENRERGFNNDRKFEREKRFEKERQRATKRKGGRHIDGIGSERNKRIRRA